MTVRKMGAGYVVNGRAMSAERYAFLLAQGEVPVATEAELQATTGEAPKGDAPLTGIRAAVAAFNAGGATNPVSKEQRKAASVAARGIKDASKAVAKSTTKPVSGKADLAAEAAKDLALDEAQAGPVVSTVTAEQIAAADALVAAGMFEAIAEADSIELGGEA